LEGLSSVVLIILYVKIPLEIVPLASLTLQLLLLTGTPLLITKWPAINNPAQAMPRPGRSTIFSLKQLNRNTPIGAYMHQLKNRASC
jgi:hypothetical protein